MTNKTDKEILEEFEKLPVLAMVSDGLSEHRLMSSDFLKQALSRKEEEVKKKYEYERRETLLILKELCKDFGDLDWDDTLHLADILEKHLAKHLYNNLKE